MPLHDDVKGHQQQPTVVSQSSRRKHVHHTMFKLELFLAFYTVGQAFFGLAMFACIGYLVWICRREDGETLNPLNGSFKEDGEPASKVVIEKLKSKTESVTTLFSNSNSQGTFSTFFHYSISLDPSKTRGYSLKKVKFKSSDSLLPSVVKPQSLHQRHQFSSFIKCIFLSSSLWSILIQKVILLSKK